MTLFWMSHNEMRKYHNKLTAVLSCMEPILVSTTRNFAFNLTLVCKIKVNFVLPKFRPTLVTMLPRTFSKATMNFRRKLPI